MGDSVGTQKTRILRGMQTMKARPMKFQIGIRTRYHLFHILAKNLGTFCPCLETLKQAELKSDRPLNLVEEISR
jgi:hypothetical protein